MTKTDCLQHRVELDLYKQNEKNASLGLAYKNTSFAKSSPFRRKEKKKNPDKTVNKNVSCQWKSLKVWT